jgi:hypothetical protein
VASSQYGAGEAGGGYASAPLPSPSSSFPNQQAFFGSLNQANAQSLGQASAQYQAQQLQQLQQRQQQQQQLQQLQFHQQQQYQYQQSGSQDPAQAEAHGDPDPAHQPHRDPGAGRTAAETNSFLMAEALLAEAARRAQVAVVMRDIEGMEL